LLTLRANVVVRHKQLFKQTVDLVILFALGALVVYFCNGCYVSR